MDATGAGESVATLPAFVGDAAKIDDGDFLYDVGVAGRSVKLAFHPRRAVREAVARADRALAAVDRAAAWLRPGSLDSVEHARARLARFTQAGDGDTEALDAEARELSDLAAALEAKRDPYADRTGAMRRALRSPIDGEPSELGFYAPTNPEPDKKYPLIVALHGMNGRAMAMLRWLFGYDDPGHDQDWEDRHMPSPLPRLQAYVISPDAHGNAMYRTLGEEDVMNAVRWAMTNYPIDPQRVTITGPSMGGIGTASIAFHHPSVFTAAEPLCGYHSYFIRRDYGGRPVRPWEKLIAEERSNISWAFNGMRIPLWIVHGKKDLPEANSGVLIDRYKELGYPLKHDHPDLGHNVWSETYENLKGASWLLWHKKNQHPKSVRFRTVRLRYGESAWVHIDELASPSAWGEIDARVRGRDTIEISTKGVSVLRLDRDAELLDAGPVTVRVDGAALTFAPGEPLVLRRDDATWKSGAPTHASAYKHGDVTGPIRDVFHAPLLFVYGASDPAQTRANEEVARAWAYVRWGVRVKYPVMSDAEFFARGESLANDRALFLVGNAASNRVVRELEPSLPIKIDGASVVVGTQKITGDQLGTAFIRPNPKRADRYVVVVEGVDALGTWRSLSLPELLPDFLVYDAGVAPARGQQLLSAGVARAGGFFENDWSLPTDIADPSASTRLAGAKSEKDATAYLP
jgi:predicted esterase